MNSAVASPSVACPSRETLMAFQSGKLTWVDLESVGEHLSHCVDCVSNLEMLERESADPLLEKVRECLADTSYDEKRQDSLPSLSQLGWLEGSDATVASTVEAKLRTSTAPGPLPVAIGNYEILARLGHGGMGVVYRARNNALRRDVALKVIASNLADDANALSRFRTEGAAIARLEHPAVVRIFDFDKDQGSPYFAMELIEGENLAQRLKKTPLAFREAAELVSQIAEGVAFAHAAQVLHRDLKPANVLITTEGKAKLADFGLAKLLDDESGHTVSEMVLGTPSYMAPEQAAGRTKDISAATDIWAIGVILYECIAGRPPFKGPDKASTLEMVCKAEPRPLSEARPGTPRDLEAISLKCLEKRRERRYASAQDLADDLGRWLRNEPTRARPVSRLTKAWRASRAYLACGALAVGLALAVPALMPEDAKASIHRIEQAVRKGEEVLLIGARGEPAWKEWQTGKAKSQSALSEDGFFSVHSRGIAMVAVLPQVPLDRYVLSAEVRHEASENGGSVGVYMGHATYPEPSGAMHSSILFRFNDVKSIADIMPDPPVNIEKNRWAPNYDRAVNKALIHFRHYCETASGTTRFETDLELAAGPGYRPYGTSLEAKKTQKPAPWRHLRIEVTPEKGVFFWESEAFHEANWADASAKARASLNALQLRFPAEPVLHTLQGRLNPREGLGVYVSHGSASFRNILIRPLN